MGGSDDAPQQHSQHMIRRRDTVIVAILTRTLIEPNECHSCSVKEIGRLRSPHANEVS